MLTTEADIYEYVRMSYVDKNILGPLVHMRGVKGGAGARLLGREVLEGSFRSAFSCLSL